MNMADSNLVLAVGEERGSGKNQIFCKQTNSNITPAETSKKPSTRILTTEKISHIHINQSYDGRLNIHGV